MAGYPPSVWYGTSLNALNALRAEVTAQAMLFHWSRGSAFKEPHEVLLAQEPQSDRHTMWLGDNLSLGPYQEAEWWRRAGFHCSGAQVAIQKPGPTVRRVRPVACQKCEPVRKVCQPLHSALGHRPPAKS